MTHITRIFIFHFFIIILHSCPRSVFSFRCLYCDLLPKSSVFTVTGIFSKLNPKTNGSISNSWYKGQVFVQRCSPCVSRRNKWQLNKTFILLIRFSAFDAFISNKANLFCKCRKFCLFCYILCHSYRFRQLQN